MREVKPTQKPVPSSDIKDLFFNSGLLDIWATSLERKYIDRFGNCHLTAVGMEWLFKELIEKFKVDMNIAIVAAGYITVDSFQQGADLPNNELTQRNHILRDEATGEYYRWDGDLPKQVLAGSTPESTGGIGKGAWVSVGDASLRSELSNSNGFHIIRDIERSFTMSFPTLQSAKSGNNGQLTCENIDCSDIQVSTTSYHDGFAAMRIPSGGACYIATTLNRAKLFMGQGWVPDGFVDHYMTIGDGLTYVLILNSGTNIDLMQCGFREGHDVTENLRAALGKINKNKGGKLSCSTLGSYKVSKTSVIKTSNVLIDLSGSEIYFENDLTYDGVGEDGGNGTSYGGVFMFDSGNDATEKLDNEPVKPASILSSIKIHNVKFKQTGNSLINVQACRGIRFRSLSDVEISECTFDNLAGEDINGWYYESNFRIHDNLFINSRLLSVSMMLQDSEIYDNKFINCEQPFEITGTRVRVFGNTANCITSGNFIKVSDSSAGYKQDFDIFRNKVYGSFNSFFANEIITSGDKYHRVSIVDNEINSDITSSRVMNLLPASGVWIFDNNTVSDKGVRLSIDTFVLLRPSSDKTTLDGTYSITNNKFYVGWTNTEASKLQCVMNTSKVQKVVYSGNEYIIKSGITSHPTQGSISASFNYNLYRGAIFVDGSLPFNFNIGANEFENGSAYIIDKSDSQTILIGPESDYIFAGASNKNITRIYGKPRGVIRISVAKDSPASVIVQHNQYISNKSGGNLVINQGDIVTYSFSESGSKIFQI